MKISFLDYFCIFDQPKVQATATVFFIVLLVLMIGFLGYLFYLSIRKMRKMTRIDVSQQHNHTYCKLSVLQLVVTRCYLIVLAFIVVKYIIYLSMGHHYYSQVVDTGEYDTGYKISFMNYYHVVFRVLVYNCRILVVIFQSLEWNAMMYIIYTQKHRRIEEILFDHNFENMAGSWADQLNYRKKEVCLLYLYAGGTLLYMVWVTSAVLVTNLYFDSVDQPVIILSTLSVVVILQFVVLFR